ncbi:hypothetical protein ACFFSH_19400 [Streptomyces filamentosus]|uniref:Uncharacterized protein n=1 Tax=Streptomyces filamentosus TaxID=67294 RepID=A0A919BS88_STRFL|nr:hypothetical protein [Streptomyces filamentosus]GHG10321.1 hypothetical protein GCM10017667_48650 [Streptomyces filamentosus]
MRSEKRSGSGERYGDAVAVATAVLLVEAVIGAIAAHAWGETREDPGAPTGAFGLAVLVVTAPFALMAAAIVLGAVSAGLVLPLLEGGRWLGRRFSGREAWGWVPLAVGAASAVAALAGWARWEAGAGDVLAGWAVATAVLAVPALIVRRAVPAGRPRLPLRALLGRVALCGTLAAATVWAGAGAVLHAGAAYEPPRLDAARIAGTWSDGAGGVLDLAADGGATAHRLGSFVPVDDGCSGTGTWTYAPGGGPWAQEVTVAVDGCEPVPWSVGGTPGRPKLFVYVGDADLGDRYVLRRAPDASGGDRTMRG